MYIGGKSLATLGPAETHGNRLQSIEHMEAWSLIAVCCCYYRGKLRLASKKSSHVTMTGLRQETMSGGHHSSFSSSGRKLGVSAIRCS